MDIGPIVPLEKTENRYKVADAASVPPDEKLIRDMTSILNKLTPEKFAKLLKAYEELKIDTPERLRDVVYTVFEKAVAEPNFSPVYARFSVEIISLEKNQRKKLSAEEQVSVRLLVVLVCF